MKIKYYKSAKGNFGDELNPWLWPKLIKDLSQGHENDWFVGIGTLLNGSLPLSGTKIIFGTGAGYGYAPTTAKGDYDIFGVRGPLTAQRLGLAGDKVISDPALLLSQIPLEYIPKRWEIAFMPHHSNLWMLPWSAICKTLKVKFISPEWSVDRVLKAIAETKLLITESMHGAILGDAFRVPWVPMKMSNQILDFKWQDYSASVGVSLRMLDYTVPRFAGKIGLIRRVWASYKALEKIVELPLADYSHLCDEEVLRDRVMLQKKKLCEFANKYHYEIDLEALSSYWLRS